MSSAPPQREINARIGRTGSRLAPPGAGGLGGVPASGGVGVPGTPGAGGGETGGGSRAGGAGSGVGGTGAGERLTVRGFFGGFRYCRRAVQLVWMTSTGL